MRPKQEREKPPHQAEQPTAWSQPEPAQQTFTPRIRPINITVNHPIVERPYADGYPAQPAPDRHTGPIIIPVPIPARPEPDIHVHVAPHPPAQQQVQQPERIIHEYSPRTISRPEKVRTDPEPKARHDPPTAEPIRVTPVAQVPGTGRPEILSHPDKEIFNVPVKEKINEPLKFSPPEPVSQAEPRKKLQHKKRERGRQRKYHQTIALLEDYHDGDTGQFDKLDPQMQRYYRREYSDYFGRDSKRSAEQRLSNRTKAARTKRESERRRIAEISRHYINTAV